MNRVTPQLREQLRASGKWPAFVKLRQELRRGGMDVPEAIDEALKRVNAPPPPPKDENMVARSVFEGKVASKAEEFNWVVANLYVEDVKAVDAPDAPAWTILQMCRKSNAFAEDLIGRGLVKMLPSRLEESPDDERFDGQDLFDAWAMLKGAANG